MNRKRIVLITGAVAALAALLFWFFSSGKSKEQDELLVSPKLGPFEVAVTTSGELQAKNSIDIIGPAGIRKLGIWQLKIAELVPEGTVVQKGDYVGELDKSEVTGKLKDVEINLQKYQSQFTQARLDCTLTLAQSRDELINMKYAMEQRKLEKEEAIYESPSARRQAEIEYEKSQRAYNQAKINYQTKVQQATAKMREAEADLFKEQNVQQEYMKILSEFTITAPEKGMLLYAREWGGKKIVVGSSISAWNPIVATLPDLSIMESITFVNEVDIQKIKPGQTVQIGLDANPEKKLTGRVTQVANIGEQRNNSDSKVFEVRIVVDQGDSTLRPAMTTSNKILISTVKEALYIPLECVHAQDSLVFVYQKIGGRVVKKQIRQGLKNDNEVIVEEGLTRDDLIYLSMPPEDETYEWVPLP